MDAAVWISLAAIVVSGVSLILYVRQERRDKVRFEWENAAEQREVEKTQKRLKLFVDFPGSGPVKSEKALLIILNVGQRPVTIADVLADIYRNRDPSNVFGRTAMIIQPSFHKEHFPRRLNDGESMEVPLGLSKAYLVDQNVGLKVDVTDAEGDLYTDITLRDHDIIHGFYRTIEMEYQ